MGGEEGEVRYFHHGMAFMCVGQSGYQGSQESGMHGYLGIGIGREHNSWLYICCRMGSDVAPGGQALLRQWTPHDSVTGHFLYCSEYSTPGVSLQATKCVSRQMGGE